MDAVIHAGALSSAWGPKAEFETVNVGGTEAVIDGCRQGGVARLVHISSPAVIFTGADHVEADERWPYPPTFSSHYAATKKQAEDLVNAAHAGGLPTVILRPKAIFGPGDQALIPRLLAAARAGRLRQFGKGDNRVDLTYVENVAHAILLALESRAAVGRTYFITNDEHVLLWPIIRRLLQSLHLPHQLRPLSISLAMAAAGVMEWSGGFTGREPLLTRYSVGVLARTQTYNIATARRDLGYAPIVSVEEGINRTLAALTCHAARADHHRTQTRWRAAAMNPQPRSVPELTCHILDTGHCLAHEHILIQGGAHKEVACHSIVALLGHPQHGWLLWDAGYAPHMLTATRHFPFSLYRLATPLRLRPESSRRCPAAEPGPGPQRRPDHSHLAFPCRPSCRPRRLPHQPLPGPARRPTAGVANTRGLAALRRAFIPSLLPPDFRRRVTLLDAFTGPELPALGPTCDYYGDGSLLLVRLPGHARGQVGLLANTDRGPIFFVADSCWLARSVHENRPPSRIGGLIADNTTELAATIAGLHTFAAARPDVLILPSHCPETFAQVVVS